MAYSLSCLRFQSSQRKLFLISFDQFFLIATPSWWTCSWHQIRRNQVFLVGIELIVKMHWLLSLFFSRPIVNALCGCQQETVFCCEVAAGQIYAWFTQICRHICFFVYQMFKSLFWMITVWLEFSIEVLWVFQVVSFSLLSFELLKFVFFLLQDLKLSILERNMIGQILFISLGLSSLLLRHRILVLSQRNDLTQFILGLRNHLFLMVYLSPHWIVIQPLWCFAQDFFVFLIELLRDQMVSRIGPVQFCVVE